MYGDRYNKGCNPRRSAQLSFILFAVITMQQSYDSATKSAGAARSPRCAFTGLNILCKILPDRTHVVCLRGAWYQGFTTDQEAIFHHHGRGWLAKGDAGLRKVSFMHGGSRSMAPHRVARRQFYGALPVYRHTRISIVSIPPTEKKRPLVWRVLMWSLFFRILLRWIL